jgi:predicted enzyme related to lactoylglutathione lyase
LVIDSADPQRIVPFWCGLLGVDVDTSIGDGQFVVLSPTAEGLVVGFQRVDDQKAGKNRLHLDLIVEDLDEATSEVEALGGSWVEPDNTRELEGFRWRCMADPEGNEFDIDTLPPS